MKRYQLYYHLKPYIPWRMRIAVRRIWAERQRKASGAVWPIKPGTNRIPDGWCGWPQKKKFAVVLTHDVEGSRGLSRCRELMEVEQELGFRSCFNFIPEGEYTVSPELRRELVGNGFEVGVHDLRHDGKLYQSRKTFSQLAENINRYLKEWKAKGFRSGFMLHNLEWLAELDVSYDASTFDTDPFEPQSDGANTVFPFVVETERGGYVELPYTLPQDSTMFLLLREPTIAIWRKKLDWIAEGGGMVLVNVHPDYLHFKSGKKEPNVLDHYVALLQYLKRAYGDSYWHALPHEVAQFVRQWKQGPAVPMTENRQ